MLMNSGHASSSGEKRRCERESRMKPTRRSGSSARYRTWSGGGSGRRSSAGIQFNQERLQDPILGDGHQMVTRFQAQIKMPASRILQLINILGDLLTLENLCVSPHKRRPSCCFTWKTRREWSCKLQWNGAERPDPQLLQQCSSQPSSICHRGVSKNSWRKWIGERNSARTAETI
jgi:hypothetical protein